MAIQQTTGRSEIHSLQACGWTETDLLWTAECGTAHAPAIYRIGWNETDREIQTICIIDPGGVLERGDGVSIPMCDVLGEQGVRIASTLAGEGVASATATGATAAARPVPATDAGELIASDMQGFAAIAPVPLVRTTTLGGTSAYHAAVPAETSAIAMSVVPLPGADLMILTVVGALAVCAAVARRTGKQPYAQLGASRSTPRALATV